MAPPKRVDLKVNERRVPVKEMLQDLKIKEKLAQISKSNAKRGMAFPEFRGLKDAVAYQVGQTARGLNARVEFEKKKKAFKKNPIDPKTLKPIDPSIFKGLEKWFKKLGKFEKDLATVLGYTSDLEKETLALEKAAWKDLKKGDVDAALDRNKKIATGISKKMSKGVMEFVKARNGVEDCMKAIETRLSLIK